VVSFYLGTFASVLPFFEGKRAVPMAITSQHRPSFINDIPTIAEQGVLNYNVEYWYGFLAPAKTSPARIRQLQTEMTAIVNSANVKDMMERQGFEPKPGTSKQFEDYLRAEVTRWAKVAKAAGIEPK
jgi:tripartite-type tricarboxylate transporter receptor subunit TctC